MLHPLVKFDEKHDGDVGEPVPPIVLKLRPTFAQKWGTKNPKIVLAQFCRQIPIR